MDLVKKKPQFFPRPCLKLTWRFSREWFQSWIGYPEICWGYRSSFPVILLNRIDMDIVYHLKFLLYFSSSYPSFDAIFLPIFKSYFLQQFLPNHFLSRLSRKILIIVKNCFWIKSDLKCWHFKRKSHDGRSKIQEINTTQTTTCLSPITPS